MTGLAECLDQALTDEELSRIEVHLQRKTPILCGKESIAVPIEMCGDGTVLRNWFLSRGSCFTHEGVG